MQPPRLLLICLALAMLVARVLGLHFHQPDQHDHDVPPAMHQALDGADDDHAQHHAEGADDVAAPLAGNSPLMILLMAAVVGVVWLVSAAPREPTRLRVALPPLRPPRARRRSLLLPPSQGPPAAAAIG